MHLLWFILIDNIVRPLPVSLWLFVDFVKDSLLNNSYKRAVVLAFRLCCFTLCPLDCLFSFSICCLRDGCGIQLYRFLIIAFSSTLENANHVIFLCEFRKKDENVFSPSVYELCFCTWFYLEKAEHSLTSTRNHHFCVVVYGVIL